MPGSVHIVTRLSRSGKRYIVRYRRGGRGYRLEHAGSFRRLDLAKERVRLVGGWLALGLNPREEFAKANIERERRSLIDIADDWLESRVDLSEQSLRIYRAYLDSLGESPLAHMDPGRLAPGDVRAQVARWTKAGLAPKS